MPHGRGQSQDLLADLTDAQREAATHLEGPLLILAGAGSGKTRVITRRVAWLLQQGVKPWRILAITFTNKAAGEMRQRVEALAPNSRVLVSTFHSLGARLLRQYADRVSLDKDFTIYDQDDRVKVVKQAIEMAGIDDAKFSPDRIGGAISYAKNLLQTPEKYGGKADDFFSMTVAKVYPYYEKRLREVNALDFDDLLLWPALALRHDAELRAELDARFQYVLIDEYQDTNAAQYEIAKRLSMDHPNLCVVGDPDQSIYKWRGSDIKNILDFERDFPNAKTITLDRNYRSTPAILIAASALIAHNSQRKPKDLVPTKSPGAPVRIMTYDTGLDEADQVAQRIKEGKVKQNRPYKDVAVFLRVNALSRALETAFIKLGVPYQVVRGVAFYERKENKDIVAYLRLLVNPQDDLSFLRAVNEPARGIGAVSLQHLKSYASPRSISLLAACNDIAKIPAIKGKAATGLKLFATLMATLRESLVASPDEVIKQVLDRSGYRASLIESKDPEDAERLANIEELITAAQQFAAGEGDRTIRDFLEQITLASDLDSWDEQQDCVSIMSLHASKGLEFPVVYMMAVEQGLLPHERSLSKDEDIEEERRLCFVGMTRAKEELYMTHCRLRAFRGDSRYAVASMFLDELPDGPIERHDQTHQSGGPMRYDRFDGHAADEDMPRSTFTAKPDADGFAVGILVDHLMYGRGQILSLNGAGALRRVKVRFAKHGEKTFVTDKVKLTVIVDE